MLVRNRAVMRLKKSLKANDPCLTLPTPDDAIAAVPKADGRPNNIEGVRTLQPMDFINICEIELCALNLCDVKV